MSKQQMVDEIVSNVLGTVMEFNDKYSRFDRDGIFSVMQTYLDLDFMFRVGMPFISRDARFHSKGKKGSIISVGNSEVHVHFWRNRSEKYDVPRPKTWKDSFEPYYQWVVDELAAGRKGEVVLVAFWCRLDPWKYIHQFGERQGANPKISKDKIDKIPFLDHRGTTDTICTNYNRRSTSFIDPDSKVTVDCLLLGDQSDILNAAIYY